jgi:RNA polymerase sigma-70 factor (ECF subfamily)
MVPVSPDSDETGNENQTVDRTDDQPTDEYDELRRRLSQAVRKVCPRWLADESDDLVQKALMRLMRQRKKSEGNGEYGASYLWRVAYSVMVDEIRARRRRGEVALEDQAESYLAAGHSADPERASHSGQIGAAIRDCLSSLVRPRRLAVTLYLQEHTVPEIGVLLGWGTKRSENLVYRGLDNLRKCLTSKGLNNESPGY